MFNFSNHSTITSIQIFYQDSWILGFQLKYKVLGQEEFLGLRNLKNTSQPYKIYEFILKPQDFIINIQGLSSNRIEALKFETKKGDTFTTKYGESSLKRCKGFEISYKKNWKCVFLIGGIDYFDETGIWALVYLGMEIVPIPDLNSSVLIAENDENGRNASHFITENEKIHHIRGKSAAVGYEFNKKRGF